MTLSDDETVYTVLTNYSSNKLWDNAPENVTGFGGVVEIKGIQALAMQPVQYSQAKKR